MKLNACLLIAFLSLSSHALAEDFTGRGTVIDGDTIDIGETRFRLNGIDAPESWQRCMKLNEGHEKTAFDSLSEYRCGKEAAFALDAFLAESRPTTCQASSKDRYKRYVSVCYRADGKNVNEWMVENGWALDWPKYSHGAYAAAQAKAQQDKRGIWQGQFDLPCEVRAKRFRHKKACE